MLEKKLGNARANFAIGCGLSVTSPGRNATGLRAEIRREVQDFRRDWRDTY